MSTTLAPSTPTAAAPAPVSGAPVDVSVDSSPAPSANPMTLSDAELAVRYGATDPVADEAPEVGGDDPVVPSDAVAPASDPQPDAATDVETPAVEPSAVSPSTPITPFAVFDAEGEVEIPALLVSFKAGGKEYEKVPLDRVVRMAQSAPLAEKWRADAEQLPQVRQTAEQAVQRAEQMQQQVAADNAQYARMLSDPDLYVQAVQAYQQMQSPEARAVRAEQEAAQYRTQVQQQTSQAQTQQLLGQMAQFATERIAPVVDALTAQYAATIDPEEVQDRFYRLTADLMEQGPMGKPWVPPHQLAEVERRVQTDLTAWAEGIASKRSQSTAAVAKQATTQVQKAQLDAQMAKRTLARVASPARTALAPDVPRVKPAKSAADAMEQSLARITAQVRGLQ